MLSFINDVQIKIKGKKKIHQILRTLCLYAENKITRYLCKKVIFKILQDKPSLLKTFCIMCEEPCSTYSFTGALIHDPFLNCVVKFDMYPTMMKKFISQTSDILSNGSTIIDLFVNLERCRKTSKPFKFLADVFNPIIMNNYFLQLLYFGCIDVEKLPIHLRTSINPSISDCDPTNPSYNILLESDLVSKYLDDNGPLQHYAENDNLIQSYFCLSRNDVDYKCSGRDIEDFKILNDRWTIYKKDANYIVKERNHSENKIFSMEDERVTFDVRLSRYRNTIKRFTSLLKDVLYITSGNTQLERDFPRHRLTQLDYLTLTEFYGESRIESVLDSIRKNPCDSLRRIINRIEETIKEMEIQRHIKEKHYHDSNSETAKKILDYYKETSLRRDEDPCDEFQKSGFISYEFQNINLLKAVIKLIIQKAPAGNNIKTQEVLEEMFDNIFKNSSLEDIINDPMISHILNEKVDILPSNTSSDSKNVKYLTMDMFRIIHYIRFILLYIYEVEKNNAETNPDENNSDDGFAMAKKVGFIGSSNIINSTGSYLGDELMDIYSKITNVDKKISLDIGDNYELINDTICKIHELCESVFNENPSALTSLKVKNLYAYRYSVLKELSAHSYVQISVDWSDDNKKMSMYCFAVFPYHFRLIKSYIIQKSEDSSLRMVRNEDLFTDQNNLISTYYKVPDNILKIKSNIYFRLGLNGVELKNGVDSFVK